VWDANYLLAALPPIVQPGMIWFYERGEERLRCEVRLAPDREGYELVIVRPDGTESIEHFTLLHQVLRREHELHRAWGAQGWNEVTGS
jgi:hypothetical protein